MEKNVVTQKQGKVKEMLLRQIRYFLAIAETGSFSEAAARCFISQSSVSQQIKALEDELGVTLLERTPRRVILTDAGRYLYENGRQLVAPAEKLKIGVQAAANKGSERLVISWINGSVPDFLENALCAFKNRFPDLLVDVYGTGYYEAFYDLETGRTDIVLAGRSAPRESGYESFLITKSDYYAWVCPALEISKREFVTAADLKDLACIIVSNDKERDTEQRYLREFTGIDNYSLFAASCEEAALMAAAGSGFYLTDNQNLPAGLKKVPFYAGGRPLSKSYYLYTDNFGKYVRAFIDTLIDLGLAPQSAEQAM